MCLLVFAEYLLVRGVLLHPCPAYGSEIHMTHHSDSVGLSSVSQSLQSIL